MSEYFKWFFGLTEAKQASAPSDSSVVEPELVIKRVWIDRNECLAHIICIVEAPDQLEYDEALGSTVVKEQSLKRTKEDLERIFDASKVCPVDAFYLETQDGSVLNVKSDSVQNLIRTGRYRWA